MIFPYQLDAPDAYFELPRKYREISGICAVEGERKLAFVQDEAIRLYFFDPATQKVDKGKGQGKGDAEDLAIVGQTAYILVAGHTPSIYQLLDYRQTKPACHIHPLALLEQYNPEGLCYDPVCNRLLIACKGDPDGLRRSRDVYSFDLDSQKLQPTPLFSIHYADLSCEVNSAFNPSGIAIHPLTQQIYLIGARGDQRLLCYSAAGELESSTPLPPQQFGMPEGICFDEHGALLIANEKKSGSRANIQLFSMCA